MNSNSIVDFETTFCLLDFHETKLLPKKMQNALVLLQSSGELAQPAFVKHVKPKYSDFCINNP